MTNSAAKDNNSSSHINNSNSVPSVGDRAAGAVKPYPDVTKNGSFHNSSIIRVSVKKCNQSNSNNSNNTMDTTGGSCHSSSLPADQQPPQQQPSLYFEDFSYRIGEGCGEATALQQQQESNSNGRAGTEIYKSRTLEDINLIYSTQTLVSTRQEEGTLGHGFESGISHNDPDALQDHCAIMYKISRGRKGSLPLRQKKSTTTKYLKVGN